ncbi:methyltransferase domain-containing protein [Pseudomassariella vexata]|uniref:Methyltransferase domain-domain-containing protein n=1 Tax=Pseudomassariella vexata TaxID=1141098 RepID=A0A1Y2E4P8_9PEZI|nr:methyltransferase domain-containing protein [Pseudomassariella vexata]ORY66492.1 methyltransferase domain-domain-containing protein [Pseudomassariella vexata]
MPGLEFTMLVPIDGTYSSLEEYTDDLCNFLSTPLVRQISGGIHVNDALIFDAWGALPSEWTSWWGSLPDHRLAQRDLIDSIADESSTNISSAKADKIDGNLSPSRPESLTTWLKTLNSLSLARNQRPIPAVCLPPSLTNPMKTKKIAEVSVAAAYTQSICQAHNITHIIDIGSGQGYLPLTLTTLFPSLRILAIDGSAFQIAASKSSAAALGIPPDRLTHLVCYVDDFSPTAPLVSEMAAWAGGERCLLVGLHACGRLSDHMLRYFTSLPFIAALAAVGCCYNHIVPLSEACPDGFPISKRLRAANVQLSPAALMAACQAPDRWLPSTDGDGKTEYSKRRLYRAILEKLLFDKGLGIATSVAERPAWGIRKGDLVSFEAFVTRAMGRLGIGSHEISAEEMRTYEERYRGGEGKIAILWTLSVLCCKVFESVIAMDRYWFLVEQGVEKVDVFPIFDYKISPRNLIVVAEKGKGQPLEESI